MRSKAIIRIRFLTAAVFLVVLILIIRLYQIQIVNGAEYRERGEAQYVHTVRELFNRGSIFFTTKTGEFVGAATTQSGFLLAVDPTRLGDYEETYDALSNIIEINRDTFFKRASRDSTKYQEIKKQILRVDANKIQALELPGVMLYRNQWRYYPGNELGARTIGFIGYKGNELSGRYGIERYYEDVLTRKDERLSVNFFAEIFSNLGGLVFDNADTRKGDIVTTIEPTVTRTFEQELQQVQDKWNSKLTGGIIMRPKTGEIVALGVVPTFNLNDRRDIQLSDFQNPLVEDVYEFGSIIKALTMASGIDSGAIIPSTEYYDAGRIELDSFTISNYDGRGRGYVDMQQVLSQSLNTGAAFIASKMGKEAFRDYFLNLKLGSETGIDLPGEVSGLVSNLNSPRDVEYATASFGQGIAFTPIAAVRALATLANGGVLVTPHIAKRIEYNDNTERTITFPEGDRVFSAETSETVSRMLVEVFDTALGSGKYKMDRYTVTSKTGTAQIPDLENGGYYADKFLHSFFGYFPAYDPEFIIFLYTEEPKGVRYASETLTNSFINMVHFLINYYDIPPDR